MCKRAHLWLGACLLLLAPAAQADFSYEIVFDGDDNTVQLAGFDEYYFKHTFTNTGDEIDTYRMNSSAIYIYGGEFDFIWGLCNADVCVLPEVPIDVTLAPAESDTVTMKIGIPGAAGSSTVLMTFESLGSGEQTEFRYTAFKEGTDIIIIDDDGGADYQDFVMDGLALGPLSYGVYDQIVQEIGATTYDLIVDQMIYISGDESTNTISEADGTYLGNYLTNGGRILASGQYLFGDISGSAFAGLLGAQKVMETTETAVVGETGDAVGDGLSFNITSGAMNQVMPEALGGSLTSFRYGNGMIAGVRNETTDYKAVSLGFGIEAMAPADLADLMAAVSAWYDDAPVAVPDAGPSTLVKATAWPNPFRATTQLQLALPDDFQGDVNVALFDATGRQVSTLFSGSLAGGIHQLPVSARDASGHTLAPGIYHYRVMADGFVTGGKLTLVR